MIAFVCSQCGMKLKVDPKFAGRSSRCPACKQLLVVPTPDHSEQSVPPGHLEGTLSRLAQAGVPREPMAGSANPHSGKARYRVESEIARGGMGAVLRAVDCDIQRDVAVKYLLDQTDPKKKARFVAEARITGQLEHPNIVPIHELGVDAQGRLYFAMKMVKGRSLGEVLEDLREVPRVAERDWPLSRLLNVFVNICHALAYAHSHGVVHRDLKPANIMIGDFGEVYVMDWGVAKVLHADDPSWADAVQESSAGSAPDGRLTVTPGSPLPGSAEPDADLTQEGAILGTPAYMPPEQALGELGQIDPRSDIYSLGAILYEILTLQPPIEKQGGYLAILTRVGEGAIKRPEERVPQRARQIPGELSAVAMKALAKRKEDRYRTVERLRQDIERFQAGRSVSAKEDSFREAVWKLIKRNKGVSAATAAALVVIGLIVGFGYRYNYEARLKAEQASADFLREQGEKQARTREAVPALIRSARQVGLDGPLDDALKQVEVALAYESDNLEARLLKGQLLLAQRDWASGREQLQRYLQQRPRDLDAQTLVDLCAAGRKHDTGLLVAVAEVLQRQNVNTLAARLLAEVRQAAEARKPLLEAYRKEINRAWPGLGRGLYFSDTGQFTLMLDNLEQVAVLNSLKGMQLESLSLNGCSRITDLAPLQGMPLTWLEISGCPVQDLTPLAGMPLTHLSIMGTKVQDLTPLAGMRLSYLNLQTCPVTNLAPLKAMPLTTLLAHQTSVQDLTPLAGMPLATLNISNNARIHDLTPLKDLPLTTLAVHNCKQLRDLTPLQGKKLTSLTLRSTSVSDLKPLQGMKLTELSLEACPVQDLTPLKGMPLTSLSVYNCGLVKELTPLQGMKLVMLDIGHCGPVKDLAPLKGMPLTRLNVWGLTRVRDSTPLQGMQLTEIALEPSWNRKVMEPLRQMKSLALVRTNVHGNFTPTEFWKKYDAGTLRSGALLPGAVTQFLVAGPFGRDLKAKEPPEDNPDPAASYTSPKGEKVIWQEAAADERGHLDLDSIYNQDNITDYVLAYVHSPEAQPAELLLGSNDGVRVWLNRTLIHEIAVVRYAVPDNDKVKVKLQAGWNQVLIKVSQVEGEHGLYLRLVGAKGLKYARQPDAKE